MLVRLLNAMASAAILTLLVVIVYVFYVLIVGGFWLTIDGVGYSIDAPTATRLSALLLIIGWSVAVRLLWRARRTSKQKWLS